MWKPFLPAQAKGLSSRAGTGTDRPVIRLPGLRGPEEGKYPFPGREHHFKGNPTEDQTRLLDARVTPYH